MATRKRPSWFYLGLHALQHRGQESAGIVASDGIQLRPHKGMGEVSEIFTGPALESLLGQFAVGHTRYSTAGDTSLKQRPAVNRGLQ